MSILPGYNFSPFAASPCLLRPDNGSAEKKVSPGSSMLTVHHLNNSRSQRVLWLLEELAIPYEIKHYHRDPKSNLAPPELLQVHPLGKSPVIPDADTTRAEPGAIIESLVAQAGGRLRPHAGTPEHR